MCEVLYTTHSHTLTEGKVGVRVSGLFFFKFYFLHHNLTVVLSAAEICPGLRSKKLGSK